MASDCAAQLVSSSSYEAHEAPHGNRLCVPVEAHMKHVASYEARRKTVDRSSVFSNGDDAPKRTASGHVYRLDSRTHQAEAKRLSTWRSSSEHVQFLWAAPKLRGDDGQDFHEHWIELFMDLILVAFLSNLAHTLVASGPSLMNVIIVFQLYLVVIQ